jgi:putative component of toxin-antitoxin plasmid stabilization module
MAEVREYLDRNGRPYAEWFDGLNAQADAKVAIAVTRIGQGNFSNVRSVGSGVHECKINSTQVTGCTSVKTARALS